MSALLDQQQQFSAMLGRLLLYITESGYGVTMGECWRTPEQAAYNAAHGSGIKHSLHCDRLACDINIFRDGQWIATPDEIGEWWENIGGTWGGRFGDPPHFSLSYGGRK